jgi:hypothetical protein
MGFDGPPPPGDQSMTGLPEGFRMINRLDDRHEKVMSAVLSNLAA